MKMYNKTSWFIIMIACLTMMFLYSCDAGISSTDTPARLEPINATENTPRNLLTPVPTHPVTITPTEQDHPTETLQPAVTYTVEPRVSTSITSVPVQLPQIGTPLEVGKNYITYVDYNSENNENEIWALNPLDNKPFLVLQGPKIWPHGWSPSGKNWLLSAAGTIYVANATGSALSVVFQDLNYTRIDAAWLSEGSILFNAYIDLASPPDMFRLDTLSGDIVPIRSGANAFIQAISPDNEIWIQGDWDGNLYIMNESGIITPILQDFFLDLDPFNFRKIQFIPGTDEFVFLGSPRSSDEFGLWTASLSDPGAKKLLIPEGDENIQSFNISTDGQLIGVVLEDSSGFRFQTMNVRSQLPDNDMDYPYSIGTIHFLWSPDSDLIVLPYQSIDPGEQATSADIISGIQIMDVSTGQVSVLLKRNVLQIVGWHIVIK